MLTGDSFALRVMPTVQLEIDGQSSTDIRWTGCPSVYFFTYDSTEVKGNPS